MKRLLLVMLCLTLTGCIVSRQPSFIDDNNVYHSQASPPVMIKISKELKETNKIDFFEDKTRTNAIILENKDQLLIIGKQTLIPANTFYSRGDKDLYKRYLLKYSEDGASQIFITKNFAIVSGKFFKKVYSELKIFKYRYFIAKSYLQIQTGEKDLFLIVYIEPLPIGIAGNIVDTTMLTDEQKNAIKEFEENANSAFQIVRK